MEKIGTKRDILEIAAMDLVSIPPLIHRSARRTLNGKPILHTHIPHQLFEVIILLEEEGTLQVAEIGDKLRIAKAQMTQVIDKLSELGLVERVTNPADRRALNISLSSHGKKVLAKGKIRFREAVKESMSSLPDEDLAELSASLRKVQKILLRLK